MLCINMCLLLDAAAEHNSKTLAAEHQRAPQENKSALELCC